MSLSTSLLENIAMPYSITSPPIVPKLCVSSYVAAVGQSLRSCCGFLFWDFSDLVRLIHELNYL